jgi:hypothetical protein
MTEAVMLKVDVTYLDGTTENISNIPTEEVAAGIYAEVRCNDRVRRAVLYRADGSEAAVYLNTVGDRVMSGGGLCGSLYAAQEERTCHRRAGHPGLHRNTLTLLAESFVWGDNQSIHA